MHNMWTNYSVQRKNTWMMSTMRNGIKRSIAKVLSALDGGKIDCVHITV